MPNYRGRIANAEKPPFGPWWRVTLDTGQRIYAREETLQAIKAWWDRGHDPEEEVFFICNDRWHQVKWCGTEEQLRVAVERGLISLDGKLTGG